MEKNDSDYFYEITLASDEATDFLAERLNNFSIYRVEIWIDKFHEIKSCITDNRNKLGDLIIKATQE